LQAQNRSSVVISGDASRKMRVMLFSCKYLKRHGQKFGGAGAHRCLQPVRTSGNRQEAKKPSQDLVPNHIPIEMRSMADASGSGMRWNTKLFETRFGGRDPLAPPFRCFDSIVFHLTFAMTLGTLGDLFGLPHSVPLAAGVVHTPFFRSVSNLGISDRRLTLLRVHVTTSHLAC
jgi:hypothetical protein